MGDLSDWILPKLLHAYVKNLVKYMMNSEC